MNKMIFAVLVVLIFYACKREYGTFYDPPKNLESDIYKQLSQDPNLSTFVSAIDKVPGLKQELSSSGLYTIMAPDNEAFKAFFSNNQVYKSLDVIPVVDLTRIVKYHIMKWMLFQVDFLKPGLTKDGFDMFKYETRADMVYSEKSFSGAFKNIFYSSKMIQVYTPEYFRFYGISNSDYSDIYGTGAAVSKTTQMNVMGASVTEKDIPAGNGVVHKINRVLDPPMNIAQELDKNAEYTEYNQILKRRFLTYSYNKAATTAQGNNGDINGDGMVDSLWIRTYATDINLDVENPIGADKISKISLSAFIPARAAFQTYLNSKLLTNFSNNIDSVPNRTLMLLFKSHLTNNMDWPSRIDKGYVSSINSDKIAVNRSEIQSSKMASNGLFYSTSKVLEPSGFTTSGGPAFFSSKYSFFAEMLLQTSLLAYLTNNSVTYTVFAPTNNSFKSRGIYWDDFPATGKPGFFKTGGASLSVSEMTRLIGNHIVIGSDLPANMPNGFYPTINTSYLAVENSKIHGAERDTIPVIIDPNVIRSNGRFHGINKLIYDPAKAIFDYINGSSSIVDPQFLKFKELCSAAGYLSKDFINITSVDANKKFTLFVPSNESIIDAQIAGKLPKTGAQGSTTLTDSQKLVLASYLKFFFVSDNQIFTDGKVTGTFLTSKKESATAIVPKFIPIFLSFSGGNLIVKDVTGSSATVNKNDPLLYPQNTIAKDGVIQIIDSALTSQYY
jgi:uncharacterized surface protein with fasciclin (FAS1) repeats